MMITFSRLRPSDFGKVIGFAIEGMNFADFRLGKIGTAVYGRYAFYLELERATEIIAAYDGDRLLGVLMAVINGQMPCLALLLAPVLPGRHGKTVLHRIRPE